MYLSSQHACQEVTYSLTFLIRKSGKGICPIKILGNYTKISRMEVTEICSSFLPRGEEMKLLLYLVLKFPWCLEPYFQKCPELPPVKKPMQFSSTTWDYSVRIQKTWVCFMTEYFLDRETGTSKLCEHPPCKLCGPWLEHLIWAGTTYRATTVASAHPERIQCTNIFQEQSNIKRCTLICSLNEWNSDKRMYAILYNIV